MKTAALFLLAVTATAFSQPQHFSFTSNTGESYSLVIDNAAVDGSALASGDEIGVFTPAGLCVGASVWSGSTPLALTAWKDDSQTGAVDGYVDGETMSFKIWDASASAELDATATYSQGSGSFGDGAYSRLTLAATGGGGPAASITVTSPNGGENWRVGSEQTIQWSSEGTGGTVQIQFSRDGGSSYSKLHIFTVNDGSLLWTVPNTPSTACRIRIIDYSDSTISDVSDADFTISTEPAAGGGIVVTNSGDGDTGSLRAAIEQANSSAGADTINFNIPRSDSGYDTDTGVWFVRPRTPLPAIHDDDLIIDGFSQRNFIGEDSNPHGPEIVLIGEEAGEADGLSITGSGIEILHLTVNHFSGPGIIFEGVDGGRVAGCYVGVDFSGNGPAGNNAGIMLYGGSRRVTVESLDDTVNVISGNKGPGIALLNGSSGNFVSGNLIGVNATLSHLVGNGDQGIIVADLSDSNEIADNVIGGNRVGITIVNSRANTLDNNRIGTDYDFEIEMGNTGDGVEVVGGASSNNLIDNTIGFNGLSGIFLEGGETRYNRMSRNRISRNTFLGIAIEGANENINPPEISQASESSVAGVAPPNSIVEIFADPGEEGAEYLGQTTADGSGSFSWEGEVTGPYITATATDENNNTSMFSMPIETGVENSAREGVPKTYALDQNYPNPFNPTTSIRFATPKQGHVELEVFNLVGEKVCILIDGEVNAGHHEVNWDGRNGKGLPMPAGLYFYRIRAGEYQRLKKCLLVK